MKPERLIELLTNKLDGICTNYSDSDLDLQYTSGYKQAIRDVALFMEGNIDSEVLEDRLEMCTSY